jgi:hypothetical protein
LRPFGLATAASGRRQIQSSNSISGEVTCPSCISCRSGHELHAERPLLEGHFADRLKEVDCIAPEIRDYDSWYTAWLRLAKQAEAEKWLLDAASYYHGAEFYLPAGDVRKQQ